MVKRSFAKNRSDSADTCSERAYSIIKESILRNRFPAGKILGLTELQGECPGIGRTPIREAVQRLHDERLLKVEPRKGIIVPEMDIKKVMDRLELRRVLERYACVLAAADLSEAQMEKISEFCGLIIITDGKSSYRIALEDKEFHMQIAMATGNEMLVEVLDNLFDHQLRVMTYFVSSPSHIKDMLQEHRELVNALFTGKKTEIEKTVDQHIRTTREILLAEILP